MFGIELRPTVYRVEGAEAPAEGYVFGTVRNTGKVPLTVIDGQSGAIGDRYSIKDPQEWLSRLLNISPTPEGVRVFLLENGVVERRAILRNPKDLPHGVRAFWKKAKTSGATPFVVDVREFLHAKKQAEDKFKLAGNARQQDLAGSMARSNLIGALINGGLKQVGIGIFEQDDASLTPYLDARTMAEAIDLCILNYYGKPDIVKCATCGKLSRRVKSKQVFCSARCRNLFHVRKYRAASRPLSVEKT